MVHVLLSEPSWQWMCHCPFHFCPGTETDVYFNLFTINLLFLRRLAIRFKQLIQPEVMWLKCGSYLTFLLCQIQLIKCNRNATVDSDIALLSHLTQSQYCSVCGSVGNILDVVYSIWETKVLRLTFMITCPLMEQEGEGWQCTSMCCNMFNSHWVENGQISSFSLVGPNLCMLYSLT